MISKIALYAGTAMALVTMTQLANARAPGPVGSHYLNQTINYRLNSTINYHLNPTINYRLNPTIGYNLNPTIGHTLSPTLHR